MNSAVNIAASASSVKNLEINEGSVPGTNKSAFNLPSSTPAEAESKTDGVEQKNAAVPSSQAASAEKPAATENRFSVPIDGLGGTQMIDERNKRGRPPKKPKLPELEQQE